MRISVASLAVRAGVVAGVVAGLVAGLVACGSGDPPPLVVVGTPGGAVVGQVCCVAPTGSATELDGIVTAHNGWDTAFIGWLTPHDAVASQMAQLAGTRAKSRAVKDLAAQIDSAQGPRYVKMVAMAAAWGEPAPSTDPSATAGHDHGGGSTEADPKVLEPLTGAAFDRRFLKAMITHHEAAEPITRSTVANGTNPQDKTLASAFQATQTAELKQMKLLLASLS